MTRAAQRLIVAGYETSKGRGEGCWHRLVEVGLGASMADAPAPWNSAETIRRFGEGLRADEGGETPRPSASAPLPAWLSARPAPEAPGLRLTPSRARPNAPKASGSLEGRLAHALLQILPDVARSIAPPPRQPISMRTAARSGRRRARRSRIRP